MNKIEENNLKITIDDLNIEKKEKTNLEGEIKKKTEFIKKKFEELGIEEFSTDTTRAYLQYSNKVDMDEDKVIEILKENCDEDSLSKVIKTKEYVDFEALESLIYNGGISAEKLEPAQTVKTTVALYTKPVKKETQND